MLQHKRLCLHMAVSLEMSKELEELQPQTLQAHLLLSCSDAGKKDGLKF